MGSESIARSAFGNFYASRNFFILKGAGNAGRHEPQEMDILRTMASLHYRNSRTKLSSG